MGTTHSRGKRAGINDNPANDISDDGLKRNRTLKRIRSVRGDAGYFLVKFKKKQIKIVNAESVELSAISKIIR